MSNVVTMRQDEPLRLDSERLADMFVDLGEVRASHLIVLSIDRLESLIDGLHLAASQIRPGDCVELTGQIRALGDAMGMISLSSAARNVSRASQSGDQVAVAATLARLKRVAVRSFRLAEELQHRSG
ncbi:hypothetical protein JMJ92_13060 [Rhodovulum visakhapatnamense]|uniref:Uncharacterized protein n=2 Tax=Paracoccaceae TaxID=31989 RepID=A0A4R8G282_9RHOB|nr:hypothetical protein [Rhodovulum visakhapatnamense]TDX33378.1 hypothetical protein EV657_102255 [Rhodovulum visakhapatnamense]